MIEAIKKQGNNSTVMHMYGMGIAEDRNKSWVVCYQFVASSLKAGTTVEDIHLLTELSFHDCT